MCSVEDPVTKRTYTRKCAEVTNITETLYGSSDINQEGSAPAGFTGVCPYFSNCVLTRNAADSNNQGSVLNTECGKNNVYDFIGLLGRVVAIDSAPFIPVITVTFNDGRTSYEFEEDVLKLEYGRSMYELWWVQRTRSEFIVQKKKGFNVTSPVCSFDLTNDRYNVFFSCILCMLYLCEFTICRYFPWAQLDNEGKAIN